MEYVLTMTFIGTNGDKSNFSISGVRGDLTQVEVSALMDTIVANDIFLNSNGSLVTKYGASLTERSVTKFDVV